MVGDDRTARRRAREARVEEEEEEEDDEPTTAVARVVTAPATKKQRRGQPTSQRVRRTGARFFEVAENAALSSELVALSHAADIANLVATSKRAY
jgi:hypothetical protein